MKLYPFEAMLKRASLAMALVLTTASLSPATIDSVDQIPAVSLKRNLGSVESLVEPTPEYFPPAPILKKRERLELVKAKDLLDDPLDRINKEFKIPKSLRNRTAFWFDIYSRYGSGEHVFHHTLYPWIVYDVFDLNDTIAAGKGPRWLRTERAQAQLKKRRYEIQSALRALAKRSSYTNLPPLQKKLYRLLRAVPGSRKIVLRQAAKSLRSQLGQKDFFTEGLRRSSEFLPYMEQIFKDANLPVELTRIPFVESSFNIEAESKAGASGIWQIMPGTGRTDLIINEKIDERNSPLKATYFTAKLLRSYRRALGDWPLSITSYNHGIGNIHRAIKAAKSKDIATIIKRYHKGDFKFASANFYTSFLAALYAEQYSEIAFPYVVRRPLREHDRLQISKSIRLRTIQKISGLSENTIFTYNLDLRKTNLARVILPANFILYLPPGRGRLVADKLKAPVKVTPYYSPEPISKAEDELKTFAEPNI